ncbi:MAG: nicotinate-nucleotide adenylyltransferase [Planctomycetaceae bacterium]|nr:nicotinate-nucleotide adenylyltransferase [Planctomycetaceae bacterium]
MRIGIYGGTFDPVHLGHLILAETCREVCGLDEVWFMPAAVPPHKQGLQITPGKARVEMLKFALAGNSAFRISTLELERTGPSYTVETLTQVHQQLPEAQLHLLIGADTLDDFPNWRQPEGILELAQLVAVNRGRDPASLEIFSARLGAEAASRVRRVDMPGIDISATSLRQRAREGTSLRYLTPRPVQLYIEQQGLYRDER